LHRWEQPLAGIALCCFVQSSLAQDALTAPVAASDNDDVDGDETDKDENPVGAVRTSGAAI
jgi:hypothetical protein